MGSEPTRVDFGSTGGLIVAAHRWDPSGAPGANVQITHGGGEHALRYAPLTQALSEEGYVVYAQDHRGHGNTVTSETELGRLGDDGWAELVHDIDRLRRKAHQEHPSIPLVLDNIRKTLPVYIAVGEHDPAHGQLTLVNALAERLQSTGLHDVTLKSYPDARHEVFDETNRDEVYADLIAG